ncbi:MAG: NAD(P)-binding domain-containing protein [Blastocatellia bacterium]
MYDLIIIGSGPAGLSAALTAKHHQLDCLVIERSVIANTIYNYPVARSLFSTSNEVELEPGAIHSKGKPTREEVLKHYIDVIRRENISIHTGEAVQSVSYFNGCFFVDSDLNRYQARKVLMAIGGFGRQRMLNARGEDSMRVSYRFSQAHPYAMKRVLVVGGGNSAAEAALFLEESGADVTLSVRRSLVDDDGTGAVAKIKPWVREPLEMAAAEGRISIIQSSRVMEIYSESALLQIERDNAMSVVEVPCDHIFALIGADPDVELLRQAGADIASDRRPVYSENYETTVPGLYVAGHVTREMHIKNAIEIGRRVVDHIASNVLEESLACGD